MFFIVRFEDKAPCPVKWQPILIAPITRTPLLESVLGHWRMTSFSKENSSASKAASQDPKPDRQSLRTNHAENGHYRKTGQGQTAT
jgi:hypothetical protein